MEYNIIRLVLCLPSVDKPFVREELAVIMTSARPLRWEIPCHSMINEQLLILKSLTHLNVSIPLFQIKTHMIMR